MGANVWEHRAADAEGRGEQCLHGPRCRVTHVASIMPHPPPWLLGRANADAGDGIHGSWRRKDGDKGGPSKSPTPSPSPSQSPPFEHLHVKAIGLLRTHALDRR